MGAGFARRALPIFRRPYSSMYAVIRSGGKQYRVTSGDVIRVALIEGNAGDDIEIGDVLHVADGDKQIMGSPTVKNAKVIATIVRHARDKKIEVYTYKRRKGYEKRRGHRQDFTEVKIGEIVAGA